MSWELLNAEQGATPAPAAEVVLGWPDSARAPYLGNVATLAHYQKLLRESEAEKKNPAGGRDSSTTDTKASDD